MSRRLFTRCIPTLLQLLLVGVFQQPRIAWSAEGSLPWEGRLDVANSFDIANSSAVAKERLVVVGAVTNAAGNTAPVPAKSLQQLPLLTFKSLGQRLQCCDRDVRLPVVNVADMSPVQIRCAGQSLLGESFQSSNAPNIASDLQENLLTGFSIWF